MTLSNQNIYAYNALNANLVQINDSESYLCANLMHLSHRLRLGACKVEDFAKELIAVVNSSNAFYQLDRVCLSIVYKGANCLKAISTHNTNRIGENNMQAGYYCYTSSQSSLLSTRRTNCRSFGNIDTIIDSYQDKPVQRSLRYLKEMGLKSGLAIPLDDFGIVRGLLFLNTKEVGQFNYSRESDYFIISLLELIAESFVRSYLGDYQLPNNRELELLFSEKSHQYLDIPKVERLVNRLLNRPLTDASKYKLNFTFEFKPEDESESESQFESEKIIQKTFMDNETLSYILYKLLLLRTNQGNQCYQADVNYKVEDDQVYLNITLPEFTELESTSQALDSLRILPSMSYRFAENQLHILLKVDTAQKEVDYSI